jgi:outer membrane protein assembly complex protein YaeT
MTACRDRNPEKSEARNPKSENQIKAARGLFFRISSFGFRISAQRVVVAVLAAAAVWAWPAGSRAADTPNGKTIAEVIPVGNRIRTADQIRAVMFSRPGIAYEEAVIQEDVRRLHNTKWFVPGGVQILTKNDPDGRVTVLVYVTELTSVVQDVQYVGAQHIGRNELQNLSGVRKGEPMNPLANELGRQALLRKYQEDGRYYASVELVEGNKPSDTRVVYSIVEGPVVKVAGVEFLGVEHASPGRLRTQLVTNREVLGFIGGKFNPVSMDLDRQKLVEYYHALGFLGVEITPEVVQLPDVGHVKIVYHIVEGRQYYVAAKQIDGNKTYPSATLEPLTEMKPGDRYDKRVAQADMNRVRDYYYARGQNPVVEQRLYEVPGQPGLVQVHYEVQNDGGQPSRVGRVIIQGNDVTQDRVILNQLDLRPGQVLDYTKIDEARMRLARLGIFDAEDPPNVEVIPNELDSMFKDVRVTVKETRTGQFMVGGAVNSDMGFSGNVTINERNFDITRIPTSWDDIRYGRAFRGAGQEFRIEAAPGTSFSRYSVTWREPYLLDTPFGLTTSGYYFIRSFAEYTEQRYGGRITLDRRLDPIWRASFTTRIEGVDITNVPVYAPPAIAGDQGQHFLLGLRPGLTRDTRDSYIYPTTGSVFDVGFEQVFGAQEFPIGTVEYTKFFSSKYLAREDGSGKHVLGLRTQLAFEGGNAPVYERFYGGGIRSMRGFTFRGMGPFDPATDLALGGTFSWLNTLEYQIPLLANDKLHWAFFVDHGTVESKVQILNYRVAIGTGFRVSIPALGPLPLAIDFAVPIVQSQFDKRQIFNFSVGVFGGN